MAKAKAKATKAASLTGALLVRTKRDTKSGFVLSADAPDIETETLSVPAPAEDRLPADSLTREPAAAKAALESAALESKERKQDPTCQTETPVATEKPKHANDSRPASGPFARTGDWSNPTTQASSPQSFVQALRTGQLEKAESLFGTMLGLKADKLREVLYGDSGRYLALACRALGFDQLQFASTLILTRKLGLEEAEADPSTFNKASELFQETEQKTALEVLRRWRLD